MNETDPQRPARSNDVRANDAEREQVARLLQGAVAEGRLTLEEFSDRVGAVWEARTRGQLESLTRDLPSEETAVERARPASPPRSARDKPRPRRLTSIMGDRTESIVGDAPEALQVISVMGDITVDLRRARLPHGRIRIGGAVVMGDVKIRVPRGIAVNVKGANVLGSSDVDVSEESSSELSVDVDVVNVMGDVEVLDSERKKRSWWSWH